MLWEITNPSDCYTIKSDNFEAACVAVLLVGKGHYSLEPLDEGGEGMPR